MDAQRLAALLADLVTRTGPYAPLLLFLASFVEYVFPPAPGDVLVVLGAWYAVRGEISWPASFAAATAGALAGAALDWRLGRWIGARLDERAARGALGRLGRQRLRSFEAGYRRWGGLLLVGNRFLPGIRGFFFLAAGASGVPLRQVLLYGGISAAAWNGLLLGAGALAAHSVDEMVELFQRYTAVAWAALAAVALAALAAAWRWRRER
ncbi:MAG TPA: VTT domain-containing protein [Anaeromyxobacteraceae bacterium]